MQSVHAYGYASSRQRLQVGAFAVADEAKAMRERVQIVLEVPCVDHHLEVASGANSHVAARAGRACARAAIGL